MNQRVAVGRDILDPVARPAHRLEEPDQRGRGVETDGIADARGLAGGIGQNDRDPFLGVRFPPQGRRLRGQAGNARHAVGLGNIPGRLAILAARGRSRRFLERDRHRDDPPVELGDGHVHGRVERAKAARARVPLSPRRSARDRLQDRHVQSFMGLREAAMGPVAHIGHRERHGRHQHVNQPLVTPVEQVKRPRPRRRRPPRFSAEFSRSESVKTGRALAPAKSSASTSASTNSRFPLSQCAR